MPASSPTLQQLIGRTHRDGQISNEVRVDFLLGSAEDYTSIERNLQDAKQAQDIFGAPYKILLADLNFPPCPECGARWDKELDFVRMFEAEAKQQQ